MPPRPSAQITSGVAEKLAAFNRTQSGSSRKVGRFKVLTTPPSLDAGEITDKGYVNQRVAQDHRASDVAALFTAEPGPGVVQVGSDAASASRVETSRGLAALPVQDDARGKAVSQARSLQSESQSWPC